MADNLAVAINGIAAIGGTAFGLGLGIATMLFIVKRREDAAREGTALEAEAQRMRAAREQIELLEESPPHPEPAGR